MARNGTDTPLMTFWPQRLKPFTPKTVDFTKKALAPGLAFSKNDLDAPTSRMLNKSSSTVKTTSAREVGSRVLAKDTKVERACASDVSSSLNGLDRVDQ